MNILGIETSCDECAASVVVDGKTILSNVINSQISIHAAYNGVVPELASRAHVQTIMEVVKSALFDAGIGLDGIDGIAVTSRPGLAGSLLVGLCFAKSLAYSRNLPFIGIDHVLAHLYAAQLETTIPYPHIGLLVSGGHTLLTLVKSPTEISVKGISIDDACGEAFDKIAKSLGLGYPGGIEVSKLAQKGNERAFNFPSPNLYKGPHRYDVSYSGLKTAVINQLLQFKNDGFETTPENICASFQKKAVDILMSRLKKLISDTGIRVIVAGGGVAANAKLRQTAAEWKDCQFFFPPLILCSDNAAMIAGLGFHYLSKGITSDYTLNADAKTTAYRR